MVTLPENDNFREENFQSPGENLNPLAFGGKFFEKLAEGQSVTEKERVNKFINNVKERVKTGVTLEELVEKVVVSALNAEFGESFEKSDGGKKIISAICKVILEAPDLLERVVAVALKSYIDKKKEIN